MPSNIEAEQAVLCSILIDKDAADALIPRLLPDDFYSNKNRIIFEAMKEIQDESNPIDTVALTDRLVVNGKLDEVGSVSYISSLSMAVPSSANCEYYLEMVKRDGLLRRIIGTGNDIVKKAYVSDDATEMLNYAESKIFSIGENKDKMALATISSAACKAFDEISDIQKGKAQQEKLSTGFKQLDRHLFGMKPGEFILIAARPSVGKTALALNIACDVAIEQHKKVAIFSMEMSSVLLAKRVLAHLSKVSLTAYIDYVNAQTEEDRQKYLKAHVDSIQKHVRELSAKDYSSYIQPPKVKMDYVIMFIPHSGALWTAVNLQPDLWRKAMEQNVFIADEQTLFAALRIINLTWTQIAQAQNHEKVYALADEMLERVGMFMKKYHEIGKALENAARAYEEGEKKLLPKGQSILNTCAKLERLGARQSDRNPLPQLVDIDEIPGAES